MVPYYNIQDYLHDNFKGEVFSPDLGNYINEKIDALPQSARSLTGCESLGLSSMKVYLKKNSKQLKSHTLLVKNSTGKTLLIPTPQALRYSESLLYIEIFHKLVANKNKSVTIEHTRDNKAISIQSPTLLGMLEDPNTSIEMVDGTKILNKTQLSKFRKLWIKEYQVSMEKRSAMDIAFHNGIRNRYLQYKEWKNIKYVNRSTLSSQIDACTISDR
jgi:hypothetical protein